MTTMHSLERAKERLGFNRKYAERFIETAIQRGQTAGDYNTSNERKWLERHSQYGCRAIAYNGRCLIVSEDEACITIYDLPRWFGQSKRYDQHKRRIRNYVKYTRMSGTVA